MENSTNLPSVEIADHILLHRLANIEAAAQNFLELALNTIREIAPIRLAISASRSSIKSKSLAFLQINAVLHEQEMELRRVLGPYVDFEFRLEPALLLVRADENSLKALFSNLAINAWDAMRDSTTRRFRIETRKTLSEVIVQVSDTGCGMDEETLSRIRAGEEFTTKTGAHSGKGMTHIRHILNESGARMEIKSTTDHGTTTFTLYFPLAGPSQAKKSGVKPTVAFF